jgi:hypothetical protein
MINMKHYLVVKLKLDLALQIYPKKVIENLENEKQLFENI